MGTAEKKLKRIVDIIYHYGEECFGVNIRRSHEAIPTKSMATRD